MKSFETRLSAALLSAALLVGAGDAAATAQARVTFSGLTITLTDLDPDDGIAPGLTILDPNYESGVYLALTDNGDNVYDEGVGDAPFGPTQARGRTANTAAGTRIRGTVDTGLTVSTWGKAQVAGSSFEAHAYLPTFWEGITFELTPNTMISIDTVMTASAFTGGAGEHAMANAMLELGLWDGAYQDAVQYVWEDGGTRGFARQDWHLSVSNTQDVADWVYLHIFASATGYIDAPAALGAGAAQAVPEPGTLALMAAGLGLLALRRRLRI